MPARRCGRRCRLIGAKNFRKQFAATVDDPAGCSVKSAVHLTMPNSLTTRRTRFSSPSWLRREWRGWSEPHWRAAFLPAARSRSAPTRPRMSDPSGCRGRGRRHRRDFRRARAAYKHPFGLGAGGSSRRSSATRVSGFICLLSSSATGESFPFFAGGRNRRLTRGKEFFKVRRFQEPADQYVERLRLNPDDVSIFKREKSGNRLPNSGGRGKRRSENHLPKYLDGLRMRSSRSASRSLRMVCRPRSL